VHRFVLAPEHAGECLDKLLSRLLPEVSRSTIQRWITERRVLVNGKPCRARDTFPSGSVVEVEPGPAPPSRAEPDPSVPFSVLFEDDQLIVVDKPAGVVVHPARGHARGTLINGLLARKGFERPPSDPRDRAGQLRPGMVQRLDKQTSGVLVVAKTERARESLKAQLAAHSVERIYRAITLGVPREGKLSTLHARHPRSRLRFTSRTERGRPAITHVSVLERLAGDRAAFVECRLETGRAHQIRVPLREQLGAPLLADELYGKRAADARIEKISHQLGRQALHAAVLGLTHPVSAERMRFESRLPVDLERTLSELRALAPGERPRR